MPRCSRTRGTARRAATRRGSPSPCFVSEGSVVSMPQAEYVARHAHVPRRPPRRLVSRWPRPDVSAARRALPRPAQEPGARDEGAAHFRAHGGRAAQARVRRDRRRGTVLMIGQPAEETVQGAKAMIADGLLKRFPKPDFSVAVHDSSDAPAGKVYFVPGYGMASVDSVDLTIFGRGGHGAKPNTTVDPVVIAARTILTVQTLVSREKDPLDPAVVTVGSIHGGTRYNIIPDEVKLQLTVRTYKPEVRKLLLEGIERIAKAEAASARAPKEPAIKFSEAQDATYNDPAVTQRLAAAIAKQIGAQNVLEARPEMVAEDFGEFGKAAGAPSVLLRIGAAEPSKYEAAQKSGTPLPSLHSSGFAPDRERTIKTAATALTLSALELLGKP